MFFVHLVLSSVLAQATTLPVPGQPVGDGWTPTNVIIVVTVIIGLLAGTLIPSIIGLINSWQAKKEAREARQEAQSAQTTTAEAKGRAESQDHRLNQLAESNRVQGSQLIGLAKELPPSGSGGYAQLRSDSPSSPNRPNG